MEYRFRRGGPPVFEFRYNPNQPRHPAGSSEGGRFAPAGASGSGDAFPSRTEQVGEGSSAAARRGMGDDIPVPSRAELEAFDPIPETDRVESTFLDHLDADGRITPQRQAVHDELVLEAMTNPQTGELHASQESPRALLMGGGAAAGKSSAINAGHVTTPDDAVTINPDDFKVALPESAGPSSDGRQGDGLADEYGPAWAAITHEESSYLGKRLTSAAIERDMNLVIDKTSSNGAKAVREIQRLQADGYDVDVAFVTTDVDRAVQAAMGRAERSGRAVPESVLRAGHDGANAAFLQVVAETSAPAKLVTTLPPRPDGSFPEPVLTAESDGQGGLQVHDPTLWEAFLARTT